MLAANTTTHDCSYSGREDTMIDLTYEPKWRDRGRKAVSAAVVVICYLIVFAGILYSLSGN